MEVFQQLCEYGELYRGSIKAPKRLTQASENQFCVPISEKSGSLYFNPMRRENENPHAGQDAKEAKPRWFQMNDRQ